MKVMSVFVMLLKSSKERCGDVPTPVVPYSSLPGLAFASAMNSLSVFAGTLGCTTSMFGVNPMRASIAKSRNWS